MRLLLTPLSPAPPTPPPMFPGPPLLLLPTTAVKGEEGRESGSQGEEL